MLKEGKIEDALTILQQLLQVNPKDIKILGTIGTARLLQCKYEEAEATLRKALELDDSNIAVLYHLGVALSELGKGDEAIKHLENASEIDPSYVQPWEMMGLIYLKRKEFVAAERCFRRVTILDPTNLKGWNNLAATLKEAGHLTEMETSLREFLKIDPTHAEAPSRYMILSFILNAKGKTSEAIEVLQQGVHHFPADGVLWWFLGYYNVNLDKMDEAKVAMEKAIEVQPELLELMKQYGMVESLVNSKDIDKYFETGDLVAEQVLRNLLDGIEDGWFSETEIPSLGTIKDGGILWNLFSSAVHYLTELESPAHVGLLIDVLRSDIHHPEMHDTIYPLYENILESLLNINDERIGKVAEELVCNFEIETDSETWFPELYHMTYEILYLTLEIMMKYSHRESMECLWRLADLFLGGYNGNLAKAIVTLGGKSVIPRLIDYVTWYHPNFLGYDRDNRWGVNESIVDALIEIIPEGSVALAEALENASSEVERNKLSEVIKSYGLDGVSVFITYVMEFCETPYFGELESLHEIIKESQHPRKTEALQRIAEEFE